MKRAHSPERPRRRRPARGVAIAAITLVTAAALAGALLSSGCGREASAAGARRVIVVGIDGMDYGLTKRLMEEGRMPNFSRLAAEGSFAPLATSVPPQSPVAWSNFITGMDAGGHGIFDFIHRDPESMLPVFSAAKLEPPENTLKIGKWQFALSAGKAEQLRKGKPFWEVAEEHGVETTILRIPANFPPSGTATRELTGMGTPDLLGTYGTFSFYTTELFAFYGEEISGGEVYEVFVEDGKVEAKLYGPDNPFLVEPEKVTADFTVYLDPVEDLVKLEVGEEEVLLEVGEWSDWVPVEFDLIPTQSLRGMCRFYLKQVRPELELYASPINADPLDSALPISTPSSYAAELAEATGRFYTQGMPEDTKVLQGDVFTPAEFLSQAEMAGREILDQFHYVLSRFDHGLLFYYFGNLDQTSHMMWRPMDPGHPAYDPAVDAAFSGVVEDLYEKFDGVVGYTLEHMPPDTLLVVMSDHGFASWRRTFSLNTWLKENGYLAVVNPNLRNDPGLFSNVDWTRTRAYGLGFNGLYINLAGRERDGIVDPAEKGALMAEITDKLRATVDPASGLPAVTEVAPAEEIYEDRGSLAVGPDIMVGYAKGLGCNDDSALGAVPPEVFSDNMAPWSGNHLMDHRVVPGILFTNRPLKKPAPRLKDLAAAILAEFGIDEFPENAED